MRGEGSRVENRDQGVLDQKFEAHLALESRAEQIGKDAFDLYQFSTRGGSELMMLLGKDRVLSVAKTFAGKDVSVSELLLQLEPERGRRRTMYDQMDSLIDESRTRLAAEVATKNPDADPETDIEGYRAWRRMRQEEMGGATDNATRARHQAINAYRLGDRLPDTFFLKPLRDKLIGYDPRLTGAIFNVETLAKTGSVEDAIWDLRQQQEKLLTELAESADDIQQEAKRQIATLTLSIEETYQQRKEALLNDIAKMTGGEFETEEAQTMIREIIQKMVERLGTDESAKEQEIAEASKRQNDILQTLRAKGF